MDDDLERRFFRLMDLLRAVQRHAQRQQRSGYFSMETAQLADILGADIAQINDIIEAHREVEPDEEPIERLTRQDVDDLGSLVDRLDEGGA